VYICTIYVVYIYYTIIYYNIVVYIYIYYTRLYLYIYYNYIYIIFLILHRVHKIPLFVHRSVLVDINFSTFNELDTVATHLFLSCMVYDIVTRTNFIIPKINKRVAHSLYETIIFSYSITKFLPPHSLTNFRHTIRLRQTVS